MWSFGQRPFPDANVVVLHGPLPILIDSGDAGNTASLLRWLSACGVDGPSLLANTHHHSDHVGGNATLAGQGVPVAAHAAEAALRGLPGADPGDAAWLNQTVPPYTIQRILADGDILDTGAARWRVLHTPGHSIGHIAFWNAEARALVGGDTVFADGIAWIPPRARNPDAFAQASDTIARLSALRPAVIAPGHGPVIEAVEDTLAAARRRLTRLIDDPAVAARHAARRILMHAILVAGGMQAETLEIQARTPWCIDCAAAADLQPGPFVQSILADLTGSGAAILTASGKTIAAPGR